MLLGFLLCIAVLPGGFYHIILESCSLSLVSNVASTESEVRTHSKTTAVTYKRKYNVSKKSEHLLSLERSFCKRTRTIRRIMGSLTKALLSRPELLPVL